jgi:hypothetical protein
VFAAVNNFSKKVIVLDEIYEKRKMDMSSKKIFPRAVKIMKELAPHYNWYQTYDNAATWFANEVNSEYGIGLIPCQKDVNKKEEKLSVIKDFLLEDLIVFSDRCSGTISEAATYATDDEGKIPKKNDHAIDCLRYLYNAAHLSTVPKNRHQRPDDKRTWTDIDYLEDNDISNTTIDFDEEINNDFYGEDYDY